MKFIEIRPGELSILRKEIIAVEKRDEAFSSVHTKSMVFEAELPYQVLIDMLEESVDEEMGALDQMRNSLKALERNSQFFGG